MNVGNKTVIGTSLRTGTLTGHGPLVARSAQISNTRNNDLNGAPYGTWNVTAPLLDFNSLSANGTIRAACSYTFYTKRLDEDIYGEFFINKALLNVNGAAASQGDFSIEVLGTYNEGEENEYRRVSIVWFEPFPASARDADWTIQTGARVKLTKNTRIGALDIPDASDVKIDLEGFFAHHCRREEEGRVYSGQSFDIDWRRRSRSRWTWLLYRREVAEAPISGHKSTLFRTQWPKRQPKV